MDEYSSEHKEMIPYGEGFVFKSKVFLLCYVVSFSCVDLFSHNVVEWKKLGKE